MARARGHGERGTRYFPISCSRESVGRGRASHPRPTDGQLRASGGVTRMVCAAQPATDRVVLPGGGRPRSDAAAARQPAGAGHYLRCAARWVRYLGAWGGGVRLEAPPPPPQYQHHGSGCGCGGGLVHEDDQRRPPRERWANLCGGLLQKWANTGSLGRRVPRDLCTPLLAACAAGPCRRHKPRYCRCRRGCGSRR